MKIIRAEHLGMCFGVRDAIALAVSQSRTQPVTVLGELVHNETVIDDLLQHGVQMASTLGDVRTDAVMITAHGASEAALGRARARGLSIIEATCPLVHVAHRAVTRLVAEGYHPVIIGQRGHVEVRGLTEDLDDFDIVLTEADIFELQERPRFGVATQTTQPIEKVRRLVDVMRERFTRSEVRFIDTVCQPTKLRQDSAINLARHCDVVIVIGGAHSNNTRELVKTCSRYCSRVHHVQSGADLREEWIAGAETVGITAGTSTPDKCIQEIETRLQALAHGVPVTNLEPMADASGERRAA